MQVYRVESRTNPKEGRTDDMWKLSRHWNKLPCPTYDGIDSMGNSEVCGTTNKADFYRWWHKSKLKHIINSKEARIVVLNVPKQYVKKGETQCIFPRHRATIIGTLNNLGHTIYNNRK